MTDPPKKRGAPPGNKNAIKHGLYSKDLALDFVTCQREGISTEITYIRAVLDCVMTVIPTLTNPDHLLHALQVVSNSSVKLSYLLEHISAGEKDSEFEAISQAIKEVNQEFRQIREKGRQN